jgi:Peptidase family M28
VHLRATVGCLITALAVPAGGTAQVPIPPPVRQSAAAITATGLRRDVDYLSSDALRGRATPSPGLDSAARYVVQRLTALGLRPMGDRGTFLQHYAVHDATLDTASSFLEIGGHRYRVGPDVLITMFTDSATHSGPLVYVGHGIQSRRRGIDPYAGVDVRGKILLAYGPDVMPPGETDESLGAIGSEWLVPQQIGDERGALALLLIPSRRLEARWDRRRRSPELLTSRELSPAVPSAYASTRLPVLWLHAAVAESLFALVQGGRDLLARADTGDYGPSFDLPGTVRATLRVATAAQRVLRPYNVVAMIDGSDPRLRGEAVTFTAHLDGAVGSSRGADSIFNAADDNASESAGLLAIAAAMMKAPRPRRSVLFIWDSGEESGLWGSRYIAANPPVPLGNIVAHFNLDMIGRTRAPGTNVDGEEELSGPDEVYVVGPRVLSASLDSLIERTNRGYLNLRLNHRYDLATQESFYPRTDAVPFLERGVLTVDFFTGMHGDYHAPSDEATRIDARKMEQVSRTLFVTGWLLANAVSRPPIDKGIPAVVRRYR